MQQASIHAPTEGAAATAPEASLRPFVVGLGGTMRPGSSSERALRYAVAAAEDAGARTQLFVGKDLMLPLYGSGSEQSSAASLRLVEALGKADGVIISSPGYHGSLSGTIKNALDYVEELRTADRPYLDGCAVGCVVCANGWQASTTTLVSIRSIVHALRGWPTPLGVAVNSAEPVFGEDGTILSEDVAARLRLVGQQVVQFALWRKAGAA